MADENNIIHCRNFDSPLGQMIAGAGERGLCFLEWHDRGGVEKIRRRVEKRYCAKTRHGTNRTLDNLEHALRGYFSGQLTVFSIPLDLRGTDFQRKVWRLLQSVPYGRTRSYGDLAKKLGKPGASRAVGRANGSNYISIIIPCHRIIESTGNLRGYGGGLWRKKRLLELESGKRPF